MIAGRHTTCKLVLILMIALLLSACERPLNIGGDEEQDSSPLPTVVIREIETSTGENEGAEDGDAEKPAEETEEDSGESSEQKLDEGELPEEEEVPVGQNSGVVRPGGAESAGAGLEATVQDEELVASEETNEGGDTDQEESVPNETTGDTESVDDSDESTSEEASVESENAADDESRQDSDQESEEDQVDAGNEPETSEAEEIVDDQTLPAAHVVAPGENLYRISLRYGIPLAELAAYNNIADFDQISVGQVLLIPGGSDEEVQIEPIEEPEVSDEVDETPSEGFSYTVELGDTLSQIAFRFGVSWVEIAEANGIEDPNQIYEGQVLKIPASAPGPLPNFTHHVLPGESIRSISFLYGIEWLAIANANHLKSPYMIYPGQTLLIPGA